MRIFTQKGWLDPLNVQHAEQLFHLIHSSRSHLYPWLPWLKRIHSPQDTAAFILQLIAERGPQFVISVEDRLCGGIGFYCLEKAEKKATVGYWLGIEYVGQGIMTDALRHLCGYGFSSLKLEKIEVRCAAQNVDSRRVPERLGFFYEGMQHKAEWLSDRYVDHAIYSVLKEEFSLAFGHEPPQRSISPRRAHVPEPDTIFHLTEDQGRA